jgi:hypothetical protein
MTPKYPDIEVQLIGQDGNAHAILAACRRAAREAGLSGEEIEAFTDQATAADYRHLVATCAEWFAVA